MAHLCTHAKAVSRMGFIVSAAIMCLDLGLDSAIKRRSSRLGQKEILCLGVLRWAGRKSRPPFGKVSSNHLDGDWPRRENVWRSKIAHYVVVWA